jgi:7-carboxy-7-deazaguanine synthase
LISDNYNTTNEAKLLVSEIFYSLQGEGVNIGEPTVFLRLGICNLHCWYCDTKYTWLFNEELAEQVISSVEKLGTQTPDDLRVYDLKMELAKEDYRQIEIRILAHNCNHLVLTGGEPMLQQRPLIPLLRDLRARQFYIEAETNGTVKPSQDILELVNQWNVSPKLSGSGNSLLSREKSDCFKLFADLDNAYFKFVIQNEVELDEVDELVQKYSIMRSRVILMPEGITPSTLEKRSSWLVGMCKERGYRFSTRLHILLYGNRRGT